MKGPLKLMVMMFAMYTPFVKKTNGVMLQDTFFSGTIIENIRYGNLAATEEEVIQAAKLFVRTTLSRI